MTILYSVLHFLVDGVCALAMFGGFLSGEQGYFYILVYNFCAFALQMPLGAALDMLNAPGREKGKRDPVFWTAAAGVFCTMAGVFTHPAVLGLGNALFHLGGGVVCIREDHARKWQGRGLGVFVAPGALGLYLGTVIAKGGSWETWVWGIGAVMLFLCLGALYGQRQHDEAKAGAGRSGKREAGQPAEAAGETVCRQERQEAAGETVCPNGICRANSRKDCESRESRGQEEGGRESRGPESTYRNDKLQTSGKTEHKERYSVRKEAAVILCLAVVVLRSYLGMAVSFSWKTGVPAGILAVAALAGGKAAGGFAGARYGFRKTALVSLILAAFFYFFSSSLPLSMPLGLAALFFFNMTMPLTLYWMVCILPEMSGFAFGFLTFALFLGFLPGYFGWQTGVDGAILGGAGSLVSLVLLWGALSFPSYRKTWRHACGAKSRKRDSVSSGLDRRRL